MFCRWQIGRPVILVTYLPASDYRALRLRENNTMISTSPTNKTFSSVLFPYFSIIWLRTCLSSSTQKTCFFFGFLCLIILNVMANVKDVTWRFSYTSLHKGSRYWKAACKKNALRFCPALCSNYVSCRVLTNHPWSSMTLCSFFPSIATGNITVSTMASLCELWWMNATYCCSHDAPLQVLLSARYSS